MLNPPMPAGGLVPELNLALSPPAAATARATWSAILA
jgi:hypothetical protein